MPDVDDSSHAHNSAPDQHLTSIANDEDASVPTPALHIAADFCSSSAMPIYNVTVDDISPLLIYSDGQWVDTNTGDAAYTEYYNFTFHATQVENAAVTFQFFGTAIYVVGAKRENHDDYTITLDGISSVHDGFATNPPLFQQTLFNRPFLDIDYVIFTTGDESTSTTLVNTTFDDGLAQYSSGWDSSPDDFLSSYYNQTMHRTNTPNASATFMFIGSAIAVYGSKDMNHGTFAASVDGAAPIPLNGVASTFRNQTLLYYTSGLSNDTHYITLTNLGLDTAVFFDLDFFLVSQYVPASSPSPTPGSGNSHVRTHTNVAPIAAGASVGGVALIVSTLGVFFWLRHRKRRRMADGVQEEENKIVPFRDGIRAGGTSQEARRSCSRHVDRIHVDGAREWAAKEKEDARKIVERRAGVELKPVCVPHHPDNASETRALDHGVASDEVAGGPRRWGSETASSTYDMPPPEYGQVFPPRVESGRLESSTAIIATDSTHSVARDAPTSRPRPLPVPPP
ncbi:hypothetical protein PUNSTDRAFT_42728 [Punctularia strigosozonata HHB-11173 SS5]|uniref:uncharacterized protein n=1 Tax=Punctularia strigosozonata (strain HHB-11173) TaxID=741275 RepID=UPI0004417BEF|nr:uncharacterized protein PUNSTDRAFT_42728 [Punctularia strigosozonata HHB-11173 SS5]EIN11478.1 hypothetical protein PUNSTDRAFT_42728 [Punctularia strigosozonata HHB-11173 SS5]